MLTVLCSRDPELYRKKQELHKENLAICKANGICLREVPGSHYELLWRGKLLKVAYTSESVNFYLKSVTRGGKKNVKERLY